jgi:Protein of unknown function (DUF3105)
MSSRAEEKERRRLEREAQEQAAKQAAARKRAVQIAGAVVGVAIVAVVIVLLVAGGGSDESEADPGQLTADARAAGCTFRQFRSEGRTHTNTRVDDYRTNPPTSGDHNPVPAEDGVYAPGNEPNKENWVHTLEHGRVLFQYAPGSPAADVRRLTALAQEELEGTAGYHTLVLQNNTDMDAKFAAVAWTRYVTCDELGEPQLQVMRDFREAYTDKAPELIP